MKSINETFSDEEFTDLLAKKKNQSWHDYIMGLNPDPKKQLLAMIVYRQNNVANLMENSSYSLALRQMILLLNSVEVPETEKELFHLKKSLTLQDYSQATRDDIILAYELLSDFLNRTYFKEIIK